MSRFAFPAALLFLPILALLLAACSYFEPASRQECEVLYDHVVAVSTAESGTQGLGRLVLEKVVRGGLALLGEKDKYLRKCQTTKTRLEVRMCLRKQTVAELKGCAD